MTQETQTELELPSGRYYYGTGRRKEAVARVRIYEGTGQIMVNGKPYQQKFTRDMHQIKARMPLEVAEATGKFDVYAKIKGGGVSAWADALDRQVGRDR